MDYYKMIHDFEQKRLISHYSLYISNIKKNYSNNIKKINNLRKDLVIIYNSIKKSIKHFKILNKLLIDIENLFIEFNNFIKKYNTGIHKQRKQDKENINSLGLCSDLNKIIIEYTMKTKI